MDEMIKDGLPNLQWFPGHMKKAQRLIEENLKLVDVAIELLDARIPYSSANPMLAEIIKDKPRLVALNKSDLADPMQTKAWLAYYKRQGLAAAAIDSLNGKGMKQLVKLAEDLARPKTEKLVSKGGKARAARCMILGIPNVGKSSLINRLAGSVKAKAADKPGVTRAKQWIKLGSNLDLLDMPGILWPKFEDMTVGLKLAFTWPLQEPSTMISTTGKRSRPCFWKLCAEIIPSVWWSASSSRVSCRRRGWSFWKPWAASAVAW